MEKIRIGYVVAALGYGGVEKYVIELASRLDTERFVPTIFTFKKGGALKSQIPSHIRLVELTKRQTGNDPLLPGRLANGLREEGVHIIHSNNWSTFVEAILAKMLGRNKRALIHAQHGLERNDREAISKGLRRKRNIIRRICAQFTDNIISVSEATQEFVCGEWGIKKDRVTLVYNGVDLSQYSPDVNQRAHIRKRNDIREDDILIGSVGRLENVKNYSCLIRALANRYSSKKRTKLMLIGDGILRPQLEEMARNLGLGDTVVFCGARDDVKELLQTLDIFVLPSLSEGVSLALIEAMASGIPVVASRVGGNTEVIRNGVDGFLFESDNDIELSEILEHLAGDAKLRNEMGGKARSRVANHFSMDRMVKSYEQIYTTAYTSKHERKSHKM